MMARPRTFKNEDVIKVMRQHEDPFLTLGEITEELGMSKGAVHTRLQELCDQNEIHRKNVGARAVVWWLSG
jgi:predicted transcriptional regulator